MVTYNCHILRGTAPFDLEQLLPRISSGLAHFLSEESSAFLLRAEVTDEELIKWASEQFAAAGGASRACQGITDNRFHLYLWGTIQAFHNFTLRVDTGPLTAKGFLAEMNDCLARYQRRSFTITLGDTLVDLTSSSKIMGVLNVTPDSFSDGGRYVNVERAVQHAKEMAAQGADIIDIGGESTRPGAEPVSTESELKRVLPVIGAVRKDVSLPLSIDTRKAEVAARALEAGADMVNDVSGLTFDQDMSSVVAKARAPIVLVHSKGLPQTMQENPQYDDLFSEMLQSLRHSVDAAMKTGIQEEQIILDPGIGFGKRYRDNLEILKQLSIFRSLGRPLLVGTSRKMFIGKALDVPVDDREEGTLASNAIALFNGAHIIRVHNVQEGKRLALMADAIRKGSGG